MPQSSTLYQSNLLSNIAVDFKNREYIAEQILTPVGVPKLMGQYLKWDGGATFKIPRTLYAQDGSANQLELKATKASFTLEHHALSAWIDEDEVSQAAEAQIRAMKVEKLTNGMLLDLELTVAAQLTSTAVLTQNTTLSGTAQWSDYTNSDPIAAVMAQCDALPRQPNTFIAGRDVITKLRMHPKVLSSIQYVQRAGVAPLEELARLFGVDRVLVGDAFKDTAADGQAATKTRIWGKDAILAYVDPSTPSPLMDQPTLGYLPTLGGGGAPTRRVFTATDPFRGTGAGREFLKVEMTYGVLVSAPTMGYLWKAAVA
jgi:hypothetical protein